MKALQRLFEALHAFVGMVLEASKRLLQHIQPQCCLFEFGLLPADFVGLDCVQLEFEAVEFEKLDLHAIE